MKMRIKDLAALAALGLPLLFCTRGAPSNPTSPVPITGAKSPETNEAVARSAVGAANFPHEKHFTELEIACSQCHHETNAKPLKVPHPEYFHDLWIDCGICHRPEGQPALEPQACSTCHHAQNGNLADETLSAKVVIHKNCWSCHEVATGSAASTSCKGCHTPGS